MNRRKAIVSATASVISLSLLNKINAANTYYDESEFSPKINNRFPSIDLDITESIVRFSHFNLDELKKIVDRRPELARASYDWGFGDWETAIGAASHVGRIDIIKYLLSKGARPDIFTYTALGDFKVVKSMIESTTNIQMFSGPHGITLQKHAEIGMKSNTISNTQKDNYKKLIDYLTNLGNANPVIKSINYEKSELEKYLGDYYFDHNKNNGISIKLNSRGVLSLGRLGQFGGGLIMISDHLFVYNGTPSTKIRFHLKNDNKNYLTIEEPNRILKAVKLN